MGKIGKNVKMSTKSNKCSNLLLDETKKKRRVFILVHWQEIKHIPHLIFFTVNLGAEFMIKS